MTEWFLHSWAYWVLLVIVDMCALGTLLAGIVEIFNAVIGEDSDPLHGVVFIVAGASLMWYDSPNVFKKREGA